MNAISIARAFVCVACEVVIPTAQACPICGSGQSIASLSAWLSRKSGLDDVVRALTHASAVGAK